MDEPDTFTKVVIISAASGMGLATAHLLALHGASLSLADLNQGALTTVITSLPGGLEKHTSTPLDVRDGAAVSMWIQKSVKRYGKLDGAVNMAGDLGSSIPIHNITDDKFDLVVCVNVRGIFNCLRA